MTQFLRDGVKPLVALLIFLIMQAIAGIAMLFVVRHTDQSTAIALSLSASNLITIFLIWGLFRHTPELCKTTSETLSWKEHLLALTGCCFGIIALDFCAEILDLPDMMEDIFISLGKNPWGIIALAVIGPISEEILFRWGIMRHYMPGGAWRAILISALAFGIIHMNPAQVPFAAAMGVMLGILYWRSGSIAWPIALHILNNSLACAQIMWLGDRVKDFSMVDAMGGIWTGSILAICYASVSATLLWRYVR